jgi:hypothetical protein
MMVWLAAAAKKKKKGMDNNTIRSLPLVPNPIQYGQINQSGDC